MLNILLYISIISALFITTHTAPTLGITQVVTASFMPMTAYIIIKQINIRKNVWTCNYNKTAVTIFLFAIFIIVFKWTMAQNYGKNVLQFLLIPMTISVFFEELSPQNIKWLRSIVLVYFILICVLSIYERIFLTNIFTSQETIENSLIYNHETWGFRSETILGPLASAMCVTTILSFILTNRRISVIHKILYFMLGYVSLFCFNARGAIIVATLFIVPYIIHLIHQIKNKKQKKITYTFFIIGSIYLLYIVINTSLGGRLLNQEELLDGSAQTRLDIFSFYNYLTTDQLLWGNPDLYLYVMRKLGAGGVENGIIVLILNYGIIITFIMLLLLMFFHYTKLSVYNNAERIWIMAIFYILGTMNPNLATPVQWTIWLFSYYAFRNKTFQYKKTIVHQKTIRNDEKDIMAVQRKIR